MGNPNAWKTGFGQRPREVDDEYRSRSKGVPKTITWTKEKCHEELNDCLDILKKILKDEEKINKDNPSKAKQETIRDTILLINKILDYTKYLYPQTQTNVNVNIDTTSENIIERLKEYKKKKEMIVIEEGKEEDGR